MKIFKILGSAVLCIFLIIFTACFMFFWSISYFYDSDETCQMAGYREMDKSKANVVYPIQLLCSPGSHNIFPLWVNLLLPFSVFLSVIIFIFSVKRINRKT